MERTREAMRTRVAPSRCSTTSRDEWTAMVALSREPLEKVRHSTPWCAKGMASTPIAGGSVMPR